MGCIIMKKLTIDGLELAKSTPSDDLAENPMIWNSVSTIKAGNKWYASYDLKKSEETVIIGKGDTEQEAIDNLKPEPLL